MPELSLALGHLSEDQEMEGASSINAFKGRLDKVRKQRWDFSWANPLSPWPLRVTGSSVRRHKVRCTRRI